MCPIMGGALALLTPAGAKLVVVIGNCALHTDGGTTLAVYAAWVHEADHRASRSLASRLPKPRAPLSTEATNHPPPSPYLAIAAKLRTAIHSGALSPGTTLPTVQQLATTHHVAASTAHRALSQLADEHLIAVSRGRRATVSPRRRAGLALTTVVLSGHGEWVLTKVV